MQRLSTIDDVRAARSAMNGIVGFVPTMGALHEGHLSLVRAAKERCDTVIVSIFVNPKQFAAHEDLGTYPRPLERDIALLEAEGVDAVFTPDAELIYPQGFATSVQVSGLDDMLCGISRPHFFGGVVTVVTRLFSMIRPNLAFFGEKDYQQLCIIKRLNQDLLLVDEMVGVPTMREKDGLALSSRNQYLSDAERMKAPLLYKTLCMLRDIGGANMTLSQLDDAKIALTHAGFAVDYLELRNAATLQTVEQKRDARLFIAATIGTTRLIDNIAADR